jgi:hypothetical protein
MAPEADWLPDPWQDFQGQFLGDLQVEPVGLGPLVHPELEFPWGRIE